MQVVDNSSAFRMQEGIPLVIPEVNPEAMEGIKAGKGGIIANPNCSTIIALMAVTQTRLRRHDATREAQQSIHAQPNSDC